MRARLPWLLTGLSAAAVVADTIATAGYRGVLSTQAVSFHGWPFIPLGTLISSIIGALIVTRHPRHRIGWLLLIVGTVESVSSFAESLGLWLVNADGPSGVRLGEVARWYAQLTGATPAFASLAVLFLLAPDGNLPSRRSRVVLWTALGGSAVWLFGMLNVAPGSFRDDNDLTGVSALAGVSLTVSVLVIIAAVIAGAVSFLGRLRRARGDLRQQLRWIAVPILLFPLTLVFLIAAQVITQDSDLWYQGLPVYLDYVALSVCTGVAVLRHRLYDIDVIVNRAVVLAGAVIFVAAGYIGIVVLIGGAISGFWPSIIATTVVALAFQPVRRWLVRVADRLAYGPRAAPLEELADLNHTISESADPGSLLPALAAAAAQAVNASAAHVQIDVGHDESMRADWPPSSSVIADPTMFAVFDAAEELGSIGVETSPGRPLRDRDRVLLADLATQAAPVFRNARLAAQVAMQVGLLDARSAELSRARDRLIAGRDAERARLARAVQREVTPYLVEVETELASGPGCDLDRLIGSVNAALDALRRITHGIFPVHLDRSGLIAALRSELADTAVVEGTNERFDRPVELAAYFCCVAAVELLEPPVRVAGAVEDSVLTIQITGTAMRSTDVSLLVDRLAPLGGLVRLDAGPLVRILIPVRITATPLSMSSVAVPD